MPADEPLPCPVHRCRIERLRIVPRIVPVEHRGRAAVVNLIAIALADGVVRGVKFLRGVLDGADRDVVRQQRVEAAVEVFVGEPGFGQQADDLAERVDAGIGAAGGRDVDFLLREPLPGGFDRALHRRLIGLDLPTGVGAAVVGHGEFEPASGH